jgi:uncharacterized membrane protein
MENWKMTSAYNGIGSTEQWENLRRPDTAGERSGGVNVGRTERLISGVAGAALLGVAFGQRRMRRLLVPLGAWLIGRAVTRRCPVNRALGRNSALREGTRHSGGVGPGQGLRVEQTVIIDRPAEELYRFWRNFENLPRFMDHLESVTMLGPERSHWVAKGPMGTKVEWDADIHSEIPGELIAWRSLPDSDVDHAGSVHFTPAGTSSTEVRVLLRYDPPAGRLGAAVAGLFGEEPSRQVADDLRRLKQVMEAGEGAPAV